MSAFRILPIPVEVAEQARTTRTSPQYGHPAHAEVATGYGPCRQCLHTFEEGRDSRLLFTYNPFEGHDSYPSPGPIFIHEQACAPYAESQAFPEDLRRLPLVFEGYGGQRALLAQERVQDGQVEQAIGRIFAMPDVHYIHLRNLEAGCFIAQIERVDQALGGKL